MSKVSQTSCKVPHSCDHQPISENLTMCKLVMWNQSYPAMSKVCLQRGCAKTQVDWVCASGITQKECPSLSGLVHWFLSVGLNHKQQLDFLLFGTHWLLVTLPCDKVTQQGRGMTQDLSWLSLISCDTKSCKLVIKLICIFIRSCSLVLQTRNDARAAA